MNDTKSQLSAAVEAVDITSSAIIDALIIEGSSYRRQLNKHAPVNRLPVELFVGVLARDIAEHVPKPAFSRSRRRRPRQQDLAMVCTQWRDIVLSEPQCWNNINFGKGEVELALRKSKSAPLDISYHSQGLQESRIGDLETFLLLVGHESHRWRSITFHGPDEAAQNALLHCLLTSPISILTDISLIFPADPDLPTPLLDIPCITSLRHVNFSGVSPPWESWPLTGLKSLRLFNLRDVGPTPYDIHTILLASPQLEAFVLQDVSPSQRVGSVTRWKPKMEPIPLPRLYTLHARNIPEEVLDHLIFFIRPSSLRSLYLPGVQPKHLTINTADSHLQRLASQAMLRHNKAILSNDITGSEVYFHTEDMEPEHPNHGAMERVDISIPSELPLDDMKVMANFMKGVISPTTAIAIEASGLQSEQLQATATSNIPRFPVEVLDVLSPRITHINVKLQIDAINILQHLAQRRYTADGLPYWLCPNLAVVDLSEAPGLTRESILEFCMKRWPVGSEVEMQGRPKMLENLLLPQYLA